MTVKRLGTDGRQGMGIDTSHVVDVTRPDDAYRSDVRASGMADVIGLAREIAGADTPARVVEAALRFIAERIGVPVGAWQRDPGAGTDERRLVGVWGAGRAGVARVTAALLTLPADGFAAHDDPPERDAFRSAFGLARTRIVPAGDVTILAGDPPPGFGPVLDAIGDLVGRSVANLARRDPAPLDDLDLGLAITAHELRGPLVGARAALEQVLRDETRPAAQRRLLRRTMSELDGLSQRLDGMLRWSAGAEPIPLRRCDLVALVREAVGAATLGQRPERVVFSAPPSLPAPAARAHLRVAVENLLRNALAYSDETSKVEVEVACAAGRPTIEVRDEGSGVPPAERAHLFRAFTRGHAGHGRRGDGLGLFIAKRVADAHGGDLVYEPNTSGRGSVFRIRLAPIEPERRSRA